MLAGDTLHSQETPVVVGALVLVRKQHTAFAGDTRAVGDPGFEETQC